MMRMAVLGFFIGVGIVVGVVLVTVLLRRLKR
jgi:hypothetical protein